MDKDKRVKLFELALKLGALKVTTTLLILKFAQKITDSNLQQLRLKAFAIMSMLMLDTFVHYGCDDEGLY